MRSSKLLVLALWLGLTGPTLAVTPCALMGNANYAVTTDDSCVALGTAFTAPRTLTLPFANGTQIGQGAASIRYANTLQIIDIGAVNGANTLTIAPSPGNTINGSASPVVITITGSYSTLYPLFGGGWWLIQGSATFPPPSGPAGGDLTGTYPNPTLAAIGSATGPLGSATVAPIVTIDAKGRVTALTSATITPAIGSVTGLAAGCATWLGTATSANLRGCLTDEVGTGAAYFVGGALGTPASGTGTNLTGIPIDAGTINTLPIARGGTNAATAAAARTSLGVSAIPTGFSVHKNAVDQTGIVDSTFTLVTWSTELFDTGNNFASNTWTPPAGLITTTAAINSAGTNQAAAALVLTSIFKNGTRFKDQYMNVISVGASFTTTVSIVDQANGTDTYDVRVFIDTTGSTGTVAGVITQTYWTGMAFGP
jgi:hypothetical protein